MFVRKRVRDALLLVAACVLVPQGQAFADDSCRPLTLITSVDMVPEPNKSAEFLPVTINGAPKTMLLDTGGGLSEISQEAVEELRLAREHIPLRTYDIAGNYSDQAAKVSLGFGNFTAASMQLVIAPEKHLLGDDPQRAGIIGPDILRFYDVSIDFGTNKFDLLSPDHCEGKVVYWSAAAVAVVPIRVGGIANGMSDSGHIYLPVTLDGHKLTALLDTGATHSTLLSISEAESDFGLKMGSADAPYVREMGWKPGAAVYHHRFGSLSIEGIAIGNLDVRIEPDFATGKLENPPALGSRLPDTNDYKAPDLLLGMDVLRHLHIYIAYKEKNLYVTPAGAPAASAPPPTPH